MHDFYLYSPYVYNPSNKFDIFLASVFEDSEFESWKVCKKRKLKFNNNIEKELIKIKKRIFLPYKELRALSQPCFMAGIAISRTDLVLVDLGIPSCAVGMMFQMAVNNFSRVISFQDLNDPYHRDNPQLEGVLEKYCLERLYFNKDEEGLEKIMESIKKFYDNYSN